MKVKDLIIQLLKQNPEADVRIAVQAETQAWPAGYFKPWGEAHTAWDDTVRINVTLPTGYVISKRKQKGVS